MILCSLALIFVLGLRSRYVGSMDTYLYSLAFDGAKQDTLYQYLMRNDVFDRFLVFSEPLFHLYTWVSAQIFADAQWFLLLTTAVIVCCTASFISQNSEDPAVSWIVFICLGSMTFAMNGMRQALAMSICLLSYRYAKEKKLLRFLLFVLLAVLIHKSAIIFALVYLLRRMRLNWKSLTLLGAIVAALLLFANYFAAFYDEMMSEDYALRESFESGGLIVMLIYGIAILGVFLFSKRLKDPQCFLPLSLTAIGFSFYLARFLSTQIYERISYYFVYFLMLLFPLMFADMKKEIRIPVRVCFMLACVALFIYRLGKGVFADFAMFW